MGATERRMEQLGIRLQQTDWRGKGVADAVIAGDLLFLSAHHPVDANGAPVYVGRVGAEVTPEEAYQAARLCALNMLRTIRFYIGSLDRVDCVVKALGLVNSAGDFCDMPAVMNGFSDLMVEVFGQRGRHARAAMGAYVLEGNMPVCVDAIVRLRK
ncbi:MAG TPA: RidA family protein [Candidatus Limiplasma stercoravium]|nr:RidA family protein [Candidatus Limiplasma stercoravium]